MTKPRAIPSCAARDLEALLPDLRRVARYLTRDADAADDLVQDIVLRLWGRMADPGQDPILDLRQYAFSALRNRVRDRGTKLAAEAYLMPISADTPAGAALHAATLPDAPARMACAETLTALASLPPDQARLLRLRALEGLSYAEIARRLDLSEAAVTARLSRARAALRKRLDLAPGAPVTFLIG
jgi:RNA polymerase sigma-70 factor, ECF subfamily